MEPAESTATAAPAPDPATDARPPLNDLMAQLKAFRDEREWRRYHTLKDLAAGISVEAAELQELFLWQRAEDETALISARREEIEAELADVLIHCFNFALAAGIEPLDAVRRKIKTNALKYPVGASEPKRWS
jgi:NTP pyrophosphatase (non-canonical NTP hydrolase)